MLDQIDTQIRETRADQLAAVPGIRVGDFVRFADGVTHRVSHHWGDSVQTSAIEAGSWYLGQGGWVDFSGSLSTATPVGSLADSGETMDGRVWFFGHGEVRAHGGVQTEVPFRVFVANVASPVF